MLNTNGIERTLYVKRYFSPRLSYALKDIFRPSKAMRAWKAAEMLSKFGFHTAPTRAAGEKRTLGVLKDAFLITDEVRAPSLTDFIARFSSGSPPEILRRKRELLRCFGAEVGRMHLLGILHGDLLPGNILVDETSKPARIVFLDNDRTRRFLRNLPLKLVVRNLVQLGRFPLPCITSTDRLRFFKAYIDQNPRFKGTEKLLLSRIIGKTRRRVLKLEFAGDPAAEKLSFRLLMARKR
jgi:serine/threonine protein kinase